MTGSARNRLCHLGYRLRHSIGRITAVLSVAELLYAVSWQSGRQCVHRLKLLDGPLKRWCRSSRRTAAERCRRSWRTLSAVWLGKLRWLMAAAVWP